MDEKLRLPVVLRYYHDFSVGEIARLLHIGEGTVHARLDSAREKIAGLQVDSTAQKAEPQ
jgi:DNA-directed RNA polymerase specialized sigma24 family protein